MKHAIQKTVHFVTIEQLRDLRDLAASLQEGTDAESKISQTLWTFVTRAYGQQTLVSE